MWDIQMPLKSFITGNEFHIHNIIGGKKSFSEPESWTFSPNSFQDLKHGENQNAKEFPKNVQVAQTVRTFRSTPHSSTLSE